MSSNLGKFNNQIENLLNDLLKIFPLNMEIKLFKEKFLLVKGTNPQIILLVFLKYIYPYKAKIVANDEAFFLSDDLTKEILNNEELKKEMKEQGKTIGENVDDEYILTKALGLKELWTKMNQEQHDTLWTYFKVLIVLCERYVKDTVNR